MASQESIIKAQNLTKRYGQFTAVDNLQLEIAEGEIFGLLGPNGAGKTTTILMLMGLTEPSGGTAWVAGFDATRNPLAVKRLVGYLPDNVGFYEDLTGKENLRYTAALNDMAGRETEQRIAMLLKRVGLAAAADQKAGTYSRGMRQRLGIADVLLKDPKVVILDEPTLGIDPEGVREILELIHNLAREDGRTVLISSHQLRQVQQICDRVGIFVGGKLLAAGPIQSLGRQVMAGQPMFLEVRAEPDGEGLAAAITRLEGVQEINREGDLLVAQCDRDVRRQVVAALGAGGYSLLHLNLKGYTLDDIYRRYFGGGGAE